MDYAIDIVNSAVKAERGSISLAPIHDLRGVSDTVVTNHSGLAARWSGRKPAAHANGSSRKVHLAVKRIVDVVLAGGALVGLFPLLLIVAAIIRFSDGGPVFFRQERVGKDGKGFNILKFRSMRVDDCDISGVAQTVAGDSRVTAFGAMIRRTSIDELPQLINVLRGDMSLVGPRPHVAGMLAAGQQYADLVPYYDYRHAMLPGLTGWAQANGYRGATTDFAEAVGRIEHDVAYIQNFSVWLDFKIVLRTVRREFLRGSGF